jgi:hypothetical protein
MIYFKPMSFSVTASLILYETPHSDGVCAGLSMCFSGCLRYTTPLASHQARPPCSESLELLEPILRPQTLLVHSYPTVDLPTTFVDSAAAVSALVDNLHQLQTNLPSIYVDLEGINLCRDETISLLTSSHQRTLLLRLTQPRVLHTHPQR